MDNMSAVDSDGNQEYDNPPVFDLTKSGGHRARSENDLFGERDEILESSPSLPRKGEFQRQPRRRRILSKEEETNLVARARGGDSEARQELVLAHWSLLEKIAKRYRRKLDQDEALNVAFTGLDAAINNFNPDAGWRLHTFAWKHIVGAITKADSADTSVRRGDRIRRVLPRILKEKQRRQITGVPLSVEDAATIATAVSDASVTADDLIRMDRFGVVSLNAPVGNAEDDDACEAIDDLVYSAPSAEEILIKNQELAAIVVGLDALNVRERRVFEARQLSDDPQTLRELAAELDISHESVRQIETVAEAKFQRAAQDALIQRNLRTARGSIDDQLLGYRRLIDLGYSRETATVIIKVQQNPQLFAWAADGSTLLRLVPRVGPMAPVESAVHARWKAAHARLNPKSPRPALKGLKKNDTAFSRSIVHVEFSGHGQKASQSALRSRPSRNRADSHAVSPKGITRRGSIVAWHAPLMGAAA